MSATTEQLIIELNKRNLKLEHIMEYIKFEDECIEKGFTFNSLIKAREKQTPKKPYVVNGKELCPTCYSDYIMDDYGMIYNHCVDCGQTIDWGK